jgi:DeoR/GlpR family transcriptional regulator of sugar metabolism
LTPFERQQLLLSILREQPGLKIAGLAERLGVSPGTVRNDLNAGEIRPA